MLWLVIDLATCLLRMLSLRSAIVNGRVHALHGAERDVKHVNCIPGFFHGQWRTKCKLVMVTLRVSLLNTSYYPIRLPS